MFVHGALVNANLWRKVVPRLDGFTRVTLDLPLGSHLEPMPKDADLTPPALAELIADSISALGLTDVTLVGNDTGGGLCQIVATRRPERIGALVLTSCDAFENFPPPFFRVVLAPARIPGVIPLAFGGLRLRPLRRLPIAYGWLTNEPIDRDAEDSYVLPVLTRGPIRRDVRKLLGGLDPTYTLDAAAKLAELGPPRADRLVRERPLLPARTRRAPGQADPGRAPRVDRGRAHVLDGGPAGAGGRGAAGFPARVNGSVLQSLGVHRHPNAANRRFSPAGARRLADAPRGTGGASPRLPR